MLLLVCEFAISSIMGSRNKRPSAPRSLLGARPCAGLWSMGIHHLLENHPSLLHRGSACEQLPSSLAAGARILKLYFRQVVREAALSSNHFVSRMRLVSL